MANSPDEQQTNQDALTGPVHIWRVPVVLTPLIGREQNMSDVCAMLERPAVRLLTLPGTGGIGKTRLSIQVAHAMREHFIDGVCFVPLAEVQDAGLVMHTIAQELGIPEIGAQPVIEQIKSLLQEKRFLLLLDNFEHLMAAALEVDELLVACPALKIVVTSRAALHLRAEYEYPVPPLSLPDLTPEAEELLYSQSAAVALFVQRARTILPTFQITSANARAIAEICLRLDGLPLAIELAAARIKLLPPRALLARLSQRLKLLTGGIRDAPVRQQTLRSTLKWSYDLLNAEEQRLFRRLSVFVGEWTLDAVEVICQPEQEYLNSSLLDTIGSLLDKSLLLPLSQQGEEPRLIMLETVREYAQECLRESGEEEASERAYALYYLQLVQESELYLKGEQQLDWLTRLEKDMTNIFAALEAAFKYDLHVKFVQGINAFARFLFTRGLYAQAEFQLKRAQQLARSLHDTIGLIDTLYHLGEAAEKQGSYLQAVTYLQEGLPLARQAGESARLSYMLRSLGWVISRRGEYMQAKDYLQEAFALAKQVGDHELITHACLVLSGLMDELGDYVLTESYLQEGLAVARQSGNRKHTSALLTSLGRLAIVRGEYSQAEVYSQEALEMANQIGYREASLVLLTNLGYIAGEQGTYSEAVQYSQEALVLARQIGNREKISSLLSNLGTFVGAQGNESRARAYLEEALILARQIDNHWLLAATLYERGEFDLRQQRLDDAKRAFREARDIALEGNTEYLALASYGLARVTAAHGETLEARRMGKESLATLESMGHGKASEIRSWLDALPEPPFASPQTPPPAQPSPSYPAGLTAREVEVLRLIAEGLTNVEIAERLIISLHTVNAHVRSIFNKLDVTSRTTATRFAMERGLL